MFKQKKVLVANDDWAARQLLRHILLKAGYDVIIASDGPSAIHKVSTEKPDLVIVGESLPGTHGFLVCKEIKAFEDPPKVILLMVSHIKPIYRWEVMYDFGADDMLARPIRSAELLRCVEKQLLDLPREKAAEQADSAQASRCNCMEQWG